MSKTALLWLLLYGGGLAASLVHPVFPLVSYMVTYYQHPPMRWWGRRFPRYRWSLIAALGLLVACLLRGESPFSERVTRHSTSSWLLAFVVLAALLTPFAVDVTRSVNYLSDLVRLWLLYCLIILACEERKHFRWIVLVIIVGSFTWGWDAYMDPERVAGRLQAIGGPDSRNDNSAAAQLLISLPFIVVTILTGSRVEQVIALVAAPFVVNAIILCNSRGATLAIGMMALSALVLTKGAQRKRLAAVLVAGAVAGFALSDPEFITRQLTILTYEQDTSATGRIEAWYAAGRLLRDYPLGAGGGGYDKLSPIYNPIVVARFGGAERAAHNTYAWIVSDWGPQGLTAFLGMLATTAWSLHRTRRKTTDPKLKLDTLCVEVALVGFMVAGFFINRTYAEAFYWLPALAGALANHAAEPVPEPVIPVDAASAGPPPEQEAEVNGAGG
jgi:probable O-glycosylation ligase (exosortase A-associated)